MPGGLDTKEPMVDQFGVIVGRTDSFISVGMADSVVKSWQR